MNKHLQINKHLLVLLFTFLLSASGTMNLFAQSYPTGAIHGVFSVSENTYVFFSQGNLQYIGSANTPYWKFADYQWDCLGEASGNQNANRDCFAWGTSGYNHGANCYQPWSTSSNSSDYYAYGVAGYNLYDQTGQADWGYNAIINGGNQENSGWRTLTGEEWTYLCNTRTTNSGVRYALAVVNNINGAILLPDDWNSSYYMLNYPNCGGCTFNSNEITATQWNTLEQYGAVFLPANYEGSYWSSSWATNDNRAYTWYVGSMFQSVDLLYQRRSVRLVCSTQGYSFGINATPNPSGGGTVSGEGCYPAGTECTLTATANEGYAFVYWTEDGNVVSMDTTFSFVVIGERNLIANFVAVPEGNIVFVDENVKEVCVEQWDTDGDGELSYAEAIEVTDIGTVFKNNTNITSFDELQYFALLNSIGAEAFYGCSSLTRVTIGAYVISIGERAFWNCPALQTVNFNAWNCTSMPSVFSSNANGGASALTRVVIGNGVCRIPDYAFKGSEDIYQRLVIPASVTEIGAYAFYGCSSMVQIVIQGNGLQTIGDYAFYGCSTLRNALNLPNSVTTIGEYAFFGCSALPSLTIGTNMTTIGKYAFWNCPALATLNFNATNCERMYTRTGSGTYSSPYVYYSVFNVGTSNEGATPIATLTIGENVITIPDCAFRNSPNLTHVITIPNATMSIGTYAFYGVHSSELTIGEGVTSIGGYAFWNCPNLATVNYNATNCTSMATGSSYSVFSSTANANGVSSIVTLNIGENVTHIPDHAFHCNSMSSDLVPNYLIIPNSVVYIGQFAFNGCSGFTGDLVIPNSVTTIGQYAFNNCSGFDGILTLPNNASFSTISDYTFNNCSGITGTLEIPANVTSIGNLAFKGCCSFTGSLILHDDMTTIGQSAFYGCSNITELTIGEDITLIGEYAFWNCPALATVNFNAMNCTTMVTNGQYSVFNSSTNNGGFTPIVTLTIGEHVSNIPDYAFRYSRNMNCDIIIPNSVTSIGDNSFANCSGHNVVIGNGVTTIGDYAFYNSNGFDGTLLLGNSLASIGNRAFNSCSGFTGDLIIPNTVTALGSYAFCNCSGFNGSLIIGSGLQAISNYAFSGCTGFTGSLIVGRQVNNINDYAFKNCSCFTALISENPTPPVAVNNSFEAMNYTIPVHVPYGTVQNYQLAAGWSQFTNYKEQCVFDMLDNDNWSDEWNWYAFELPGPTDVVCVNSNCHLDMDANVLHLYVLNLNDVLTINNGNTLSTTYGVGTLQPSQLVIEDGGQLVNTISNTYGTVKKQINGYGSDDGGWYTLASPIYGGTATSTLAMGNYDLYAYDETTATWLNQKMEGSIDKLNLSQGYLYASQSPKTVNFAGQLNASNAEISIPITYTSGSGSLAGFNLLGNPFTNNISITDVKINGTAQTVFYRAEGGNTLVAYVAEDNEPIKLGEGFFVQVAEDDTLTFGDNSSRSKSTQGCYVRLVLSKNGQIVDRAYLSMDKGITLEKISTDSNGTQLYFENDSKRYAVADNEANSSTMPVFLENANGTYTIEASLLNTECDYLHLIDNLTGADIDLLATPAYTFEATTSDYASRFRLVFSISREANKE